MSNLTNCVEGCNLPSTPNDLKVLVCQLKREVEKLINETEAKLLCHDGKIAELCKYVKDNLGNTLRCMIDTMMSNRRTRRTYYGNTFMFIK